MKNMGRIFLAILMFTLLFTFSSLAADTSKRAPEVKGDPMYQCAKNATITQGFEDGVMPPSGWFLHVTNPNETWYILDNPHSGSYNADILYDPALIPQEEVIYSSQLVPSTQLLLSLWSYGSVYWCRDDFDNCDLRIYVDADHTWDNGNEQYVYTADADWPATWEYGHTSLDLSGYVTGSPLYIAFAYIGVDGAQVGLDDIEITVDEGGGTDPYEPDNTPGTAQRLSGSPVTQDHTIDPDEDVDWFVICMQNGTGGRAETSNLGGSRPDTVLEIYDDDCNMVASNDDGGAGWASLVEWTAAYTGDYYIKARTFGGSYPHCDDQGGGPAFCSYTINIQWVACDGEDPDIDVDPQSIDITMPCNASQNRTLEIANVGGADLVVSNICDEETLLTVAPKLDRSPVKGQGFSRFSDALKALGLPSNKEAQGDVIRQCASSVPTVVLMGHHYVSSQGVLYVVSEDGTGTIYKMDENCNAVSTLPGPTGEMNGVTFDGQYLWVSDYYGQDAESDWLYKLNASTGAVIGSWDLRPQGFDGILGLAWDGQHLWAASIWNSTIFKLDTQGNVLGSFSVAWSPSGMDWDGQYLLCTDNDSTTIRRLNSAGTVIDSMPGVSSSNTFGVTCGTDGLWVSSFANDTLYLLECDWCGDVPPPCACSSDAPWMSVNPTSGTVQPGGHMNVTVSFNTTGMSPGDYYGNIKIASNDPDEGCVVVPVTLHVTSCNGHPCVEDDTGALDIQGSNGPPGGTVSIPVRIQNAPNAVSALGFDVTYPSVLEYKGFTEGPCVAGWTIFDVTPQGPGLVRVGGLTTGNGISAGQSCIVVYLNFDIDPECDSFYELDLQDLKDDISGWSISHGCFDCTGCDCDINDDDDITPGDALCAFQKYMGICPTDCGPCDEICCDVNADGECTPADALEIFREYMGEPSVCSP